jgi:hypothetical protein
MQFIECDDLGGRMIDLCQVFPTRFHPLYRSLHDSTPRSYQWTETPSLPSTGATPSGASPESQYRIHGKREKGLTRVARVSLPSFVNPTFDFVRTGTQRTIQYLRFQGKG